MSIILTILILCVIVILHEFGHFFVAKKCGVLVEEFAIGMGPKLCSFTKGDTMYSIRLFPVGGFCRMADETEDSKKLGFNQVSLVKRILISFAGPFMNFVLAFVIFVGIVMCTGYSTTNIVHVADNSPAAKAGIQVGDKILSYGGHRIHTIDELDYYKGRLKDSNATVIVKRGNEKIEAIVAPEKGESGYILGVSLDFRAPLINVLGYTEQDLANIPKGSFISYFAAGYNGLIAMLKIMVYSFLDLFNGTVAVQELSGPIGVTNAVGTVYTTAAKVSVWAVILSMLNMAALLSVNLGIINLFPLPALDGGRIVIYIIELFVGKELPQKVEGIIHTVGFVLIMGLGIFIAFNDVLKLL